MEGVVRPTGGLPLRSLLQPFVDVLGYKGIFIEFRIGCIAIGNPGSQVEHSPEVGQGIARELAQTGFDLVLNGMRPETEVQPVLAELAAGSLAYSTGQVIDVGGGMTVNRF